MTQHPLKANAPSPGPYPKRHPHRCLAPTRGYGYSRQHGTQMHGLGAGVPVSRVLAHYLGGSAHWGKRRCSILGWMMAADTAARVDAGICLRGRRLLACPPRRLTPLPLGRLPQQRRAGTTCTQRSRFACPGTGLYSNRQHAVCVLVSSAGTLAPPPSARAGGPWPSRAA